MHDYPDFGAFAVTLTVEDASGVTDSLTGEVAAPGIDATAGTAGRIDEFLDLEIESSIEDAVGSVGDEITATLDDAFGRSASRHAALLSCSSSHWPHSPRRSSRGESPGSVSWC